MVTFPEETACEMARRNVDALRVVVEMAGERGDHQAVAKASIELAFARAALEIAERQLARARVPERKRSLQALVRMQAANACRRYIRLPHEAQFLGVTTW